MEIVPIREMQSVGSLWQGAIDELGKLTGDTALRLSLEDVTAKGYTSFSGFRTAVHLQFPRKFITRLSDTKRLDENFIYIALRKH